LLYLKIKQAVSLMIIVKINKRPLMNVRGLCMSFDPLSI
jgi:hypothetical protein